MNDTLTHECIVRTYAWLNRIALFSPDNIIMTTQQFELATTEVGLLGKRIRG